jgi:hypothetical protein
MLNLVACKETARLLKVKVITFFTQSATVLAYSNGACLEKE